VTVTENDKPLSVLFVLESEPESSCSLAFFNSYVESLMDTISPDVTLSIFYPVFSDSEEHYSLNIVPGDKFSRFITYVPKKHVAFRETFSSSSMENVFRYILKDESFDCIHIWSFKNHSFNYPFIAGERSIPVIVSIYDGFLSSPFIFEKGIIGSGMTEKMKIRISNFVTSPISSFLQKAGTFFPDNRSKKNGYWFELIGRYSSFYNRYPASSLDKPVAEERDSLSLEAINFTEKFIINSEAEYNLYYRSSIPENKVMIMEQGGAGESSFEPMPFEIEGAVKFGFLGELLPEEGISELIEAFNMLYAEGYQNEIHIYGEIAQNRSYFQKLKRNVRNSNIFFRGPIEPGRLNAALVTFDVLIAPSKWYRNDSFLAKTAVNSRKALIVPAKNNISEIIRKHSRGLIIDEINPRSIFNAVSELERNRKRLYYFMRVTDDFKIETVKGNAVKLFDLYSSLSRKKVDLDKMLLKRKLHRKKIDRSRG
jgi:glycosyltransferase involved in cell wall biosynthesis